MYPSLMADLVGIDTTPQGAADLAARHGFSGLDLRLARWADWLEDHGVVRFADAMAAAGLRAGYASVLTRTLSARPEDWAHAMTELPRIARVAAALGFTRAGVVVLPFDDRLDLAANWKRHLDRLRQAAPVLADAGLSLGLEYVAPESRRADAAFPFVHDLAGTRALLAEATQPNAGLMLDSFHWHAAGETAGQLAELGPDEVVNVHLNDAPLGTPRARLDVRERELPGVTGVIDLKAFLLTLESIGYAGPLSVEPTHERWSRTPPEEAAARAAASLGRALALLDGEENPEASA